MANEIELTEPADFTDHDRHWAKGLRSLILLKLQELGPLTTREAANACGVSEKALAPRWTELQAQGLARVIGFRSSFSGLGRRQKVWEATGNVLQGANHQHLELFTL